MLLKRMDVTIQSFLWSEQVQGREDEILSTIKAQRESIVEEPSRYTVLPYPFPLYDVIPNESSMAIAG
jgi:hypothetical protein